MTDRVTMLAHLLPMLTITWYGNSCLLLTILCLVVRLL